MKYWKYNLLQYRTNEGTEEEPIWRESFIPKIIPATVENEEIAKAEAYNGEYEIFDDGIPEPAVEPSTDEILNALLGVTE